MVVAGCAVMSTNPLQSVIGQIDDLAIWSRALAPPEVFRLFTEGIRESDSDLSLFYDFNEGSGGYAKNKGRAGGKYDLILGRSNVIGSPNSYQVANKYGGVDQLPFTQPVWALQAPPTAADGVVAHCKAPIGNLQPTGYGGKSFVNLKESTSIEFILEYFHPAGRKSNVRISRLPVQGCLEQVVCAGSDCNRTPVVSAPFEMSSSPHASLVSPGDRALPLLCSILPTLTARAPFL